ncbi:MAG: permease [Spirochaetia bacterium]|nr:permease [Spirochaetia bacterium]
MSKFYSPIKPLLPGLLFGLFIVGSLLFRFEFGLTAGRRFLQFGGEMVKIVPFAFILIGLFEVWVPKHVVERHLGKQAGLRAHLWAVLLAGTTVGGLYVAFPVAAALQRKGARLSFLFTYIGASGVCRIPMTLFEASFLGIEFTLIRYAIAVPLIVLSSELMGEYLQRREYEINLQ